MSDKAIKHMDVSDSNFGYKRACGLACLDKVAAHGRDMGCFPP